LNYRLKALARCADRARGEERKRLVEKLGNFNQRLKHEEPSAL
jgi:hypothetical protein